MNSSTRTFLAAAVAINLALVGYFIMRPQPAGITRTLSSSGSLDADKAPGRRYEVLAARAGDGGARLPVLRAAQGDEVQIEVTSDEAGALMLHGYTDPVQVSQNGKATIRLVATITGRFPLHVHGHGGSHRELAYLEIEPR